MHEILNSAAWSAQAANAMLMSEPRGTWETSALRCHTMASEGHGVSWKPKGALESSY